MTMKTNGQNRMPAKIFSRSGLEGHALSWPRRSGTRRSASLHRANHSPPGGPCFVVAAKIRDATKRVPPPRGSFTSWRAMLCRGREDQGPDEARPSTAGYGNSSTTRLDLMRCTDGHPDD